MSLAVRLGCGLVIAAFVSGCGDQATATYNAANAYNAQHANEKPSQKSIDDRIAKIQQDPNMPEQAKAMAIGQLQAHAGKAEGPKH